MKRLLLLCLLGLLVAAAPGCIYERHDRGYYGHRGDYGRGYYGHGYYDRGHGYHGHDRW